MALDKIGNAAQVANLYSNTSKVADAGGVGQGPSFGEILKQGLEGAAQTLKAGEAASAAAVTGKATSLNDVVNAVTAAEMTLQTVVAIRDRLVSAYQDIMRMPI